MEMEGVKSIKEIEQKKEKKDLFFSTTIIQYLVYCINFLLLNICVICLFVRYLHLNTGK